MNVTVSRRTPMKNYRFGLFLACLCLTLASAEVYAQNETLTAAAGDRYVISAKAGGVNFVDGGVAVARKNGRSGYLTKGDKLDIGDKVSTGAASKVEILLNPGSYLRLGDNARFEFITTSLDDLQLKFESGSAILEVFAGDDFQVALSTPKSKFLLVESGVYRLDILPGGVERLEVWQGSARAAEDTGLIKRGRSATTTASGSALIAKFDRDEKDALDVWSKARSKDLAKLTGKLNRDMVRTALMRSFLGRGWNMYNSFGLWIYEPRFGGYCFLPFGNGWGSPYGYGYGSHIGWYNLPPVVWYPPSGGGSTGGSTNPPANTPVASAGDRAPVPPFVRMQENMGGSRGGFGNSGRRSSNPDSSWPSYSTSPSPFPSSAPVTDRGAAKAAAASSTTKRP